MKSYKPASYVKDCPEDSFTPKKQLKFIDCSLGVNPYGCSPLVADLFANSFEKHDFCSYPSFPYSDLKEEIISYWKDCCSINHNNIRFGGGSIDVLRSINRIFIGKGSKVLGSAPTFTSYPSDVELNEGIFDYVLLSENENYKFDVDKFLSRITSEHNLIYIDNPNNPTGQIIPLEQIERIAEKALENNVCLLVDEAYGDFMDNSNSALNLLCRFENVMVTRTFSKGFGLAGLRVGYVIAGDYLSEIYSKAELPFTINSLGCIAASAALKDGSFISESMNKICSVKEKIAGSFKFIKVLETSPGVPIMTLVHPDTDIDLNKLLEDNGILTESGNDFHGLGKNFARMRVPAHHEELTVIIGKIENGFLAI
jgi:histidinol-phosphate aminotransferase